MDFNRPMHFIETPPPDDFFYPLQQQQHIEAGEQAANNLLMEAQQPMLQPNLPLFWKHQLSQIQQTIAFKGPSLGLPHSTHHLNPLWLWHTDHKFRHTAALLQSGGADDNGDDPPCMVSSCQLSQFRNSQLH